MSDFIKHECGLALIRLLKPLDFYREKYGTAFYGLNKLHLLMQKQHNRGQDGAGIGTIKLNVQPGNKYIDRLRSIADQPLKDIFGQIDKTFVEEQRKNPQFFDNGETMKENLPYMGELLLGHLRYGTFGGYSIESCHPFLRQNNWMSRNLVCAGNFNMTNVDELVQNLIELGQHPKEKSDTVTVMEKIGHFLDEENERLFQQFKKEGHSNQRISELIQEHLDVKDILIRSSKRWDGGYLMSGLFGHGDAFILRDPAGIRPGFWYADDEIVVVASERPAIQTAFGLKAHQVKEVTPGSAIIIKRNGHVEETPILDRIPEKQCTFERIYFSRGSDADIYIERMKLGELLCEEILGLVANNFENTVFSYIPNTAEVAFLGMVKGMESILNKQRTAEIVAMGSNPDPERIEKLLTLRPRVEKAVIKDAKMRTFITQDSDRDDLVSYVYDTTFGILKENVDSLVIIDDSIVRGTTLKQSILRVLDRLDPKQVIIVSSAPQIRYPDCYGINMSRMSEFIAFKAAVSLLKKRGMESLIEEVYNQAIEELNKPVCEVNAVKRIYEPFTDQEIADEVVNLVRPETMKAEVKVVFQTIEKLHQACPNHHGDWYFSGDYPTPGGIRVVNRAFANWFEGSNERSY